VSLLFLQAIGFLWQRSLMVCSWRSYPFTALEPAGIAGSKQDGSATSVLRGCRLPQRDGRGESPLPIHALGRSLGSSRLAFGLRAVPLLDQEARCPRFRNRTKVQG
jgi:hypothetical protein